MYAIKKLVDGGLNYISDNDHNMLKFESVQEAVRFLEIEGIPRHLAIIENIDKPLVIHIYVEGGCVQEVIVENLPENIKWAYEIHDNDIEEEDFDENDLVLDEENNEPDE